MATTSKTLLNLSDVQSAIEKLAISQSEIGLAVLAILETHDTPLDKATSDDLYRRVGASVADLQRLAAELLDVPHDG